MANDIKNSGLWPDGELKIKWVRHHMPLLNGLEKEFSEAHLPCTVRIAGAPLVDISSTEIREGMAAGRDMSGYLM